MKNRLRRLLCLFGKHEFYVAEVLSERAGRYGCRCCSKQWAAHHELRAMVPWDEEFTAFYRERTLEVQHASDCAVHREPAFPAGPCNCGARVSDGSREAGKTGTGLIEDDSASDAQKDPNT